MSQNPTKNGAEVLLEQLESKGVDCIFASPIAVMAPIWEVLARRGDDMNLRYFRCRHELLAVGLASGYYKATGRSQIVFLPTSLGVQNGSMGLRTALQERTPMTVLSPDTFTYGEAAEEAQQASSNAADVVPAAVLFRELHNALPDDSICVDEIIAQIPQMIQFLYESKPLSQYRGWVGALGTSLGTALGIKLARPEQFVVCILGDGAWHYNPVPAALGFAQEYKVPLLIVLCNNRQYASQTWNVFKYYPDGAAVRQGNFVGNVIQPTPDYGKVAEAYGGTGERVQTTDALRPALRRALDVVASGQTFLLDVIISP